VKVARTVREVRALLERERGAGARIALVPTMGALHDGHLSLVRSAREVADVVVMSIFVNPLQFGPSEDFDAYPRDEGRDLELAEQEKVDIVFAPAAEEVYPEGSTVTVSVGPLGTTLEGAIRPGHFDGVATVVAKLLNVVMPHVALFGQKDAQQVAVIRKLVSDLAYDIDIEVGETVREPDGLALSSRNVYLSAAERERATVLWRSLQRGADVLAGGGAVDTAERAMAEVLAAEPGVEPGYARIVEPVTFEPPAPGGPYLLLVTARLGTTRLIDNLVVPQVDRRSREAS